MMNLLFRARLVLALIAWHHGGDTLRLLLRDILIHKRLKVYEFQELLLEVSAKFGILREDLFPIGPAQVVFPDLYVFHMCSKYIYRNYSGIPDDVHMEKQHELFGRIAYAMLSFTVKPQHRVRWKMLCK